MKMQFTNYSEMTCYIFSSSRVLVFDRPPNCKQSITVWLFTTNVYWHCFKVRQDLPMGKLSYNDKPCMQTLREQGLGGWWESHHFQLPWQRVEVSQHC